MQTPRQNNGTLTGEACARSAPLRPSDYAIVGAQSDGSEPVRRRPKEPQSEARSQSVRRARSADLAQLANTRNAPEREHRSSAPERRAVAPWDSAISTHLELARRPRWPHRTTAIARRAAIRDAPKRPLASKADLVAASRAASCGMARGYPLAARVSRARGLLGSEDLGRSHRREALGGDEGHQLGCGQHDERQSDRLEPRAHRP
jgi:hypothetical protein